MSLHILRLLILAGRKQKLPEFLQNIIHNNIHVRASFYIHCTFTAIQ